MPVIENINDKKYITQGSDVDTFVTDPSLVDLNKIKLDEPWRIIKVNGDNAYAFTYPRSNTDGGNNAYMISLNDQKNNDRYVYYYAYKWYVDAEGINWYFIVDGTYNDITGLTPTYKSRTYWMPINGTINAGKIVVETKKEENLGIAGGHKGIVVSPDVDKTNKNKETSVDPSIPKDPTGSASNDDDMMNEINEEVNMIDEILSLDDLYDASANYSAQSFESIVGMPFQFMGNVDVRAGKSTYGRKYTEDILYDMPIASIIPGSPQMLKGGLDIVKNIQLIKAKKGLMSFMEDMVAGANNMGSAIMSADDLLENLLGGKYARYFGFSTSYTKYMEYVNSCCHLFIHYLGISDLQYKGRPYRNYSDEIDYIESDKGSGLNGFLGQNRAVHVYYQPDSSLGQSFSNVTGESGLKSSLSSLSEQAKEYAFLLGASGVKNGGITSVVNEDNFNKVANNGLIGKFFSRTGEGAGVLLSGSNLIFPEIYKDSTMSGKEYTLNIKLASPYGDLESVFLYVLRPLARLLPLALPRQLGPNGYTAPFIVQAFSKGMFNCQMGIVSSLSIRRGGSGSEMQTIHNVPTELEITMTIKDLYDNISLSNLYGKKSLEMLFNNIGLLDFMASYSGYSLNTIEVRKKFLFMLDVLYNKFNYDLGIPIFQNGAKSFFPKQTSQIQDWYRDAVVRMGTMIAT